MDGLHAFLSIAFEHNLQKFNKIREAGIDKCPMTFPKFTEFSEGLIDEQSLQTVLSVFDLLPKFQEVNCVFVLINELSLFSKERSIVVKALEEGSDSLSPGQVLYALNERYDDSLLNEWFLLTKLPRWFSQWCQHACMSVDSTADVLDSGMVSSSQALPSFKLLLSMKPSATLGSYTKPDEIDNVSLQDVNDLSSFSSQLLNGSSVDGVLFVSASVWFALTGVYGGGPELPRRLRSISLDSKVADIDLCPNVLQGYWCSSSGHPCSFQHKALVSKGGDARELIKWALRDVGVLDQETGGFSSSAEATIGVNEVNIWVLRNLKETAANEDSSARKASIDRMSTADMPQFAPVQKSRSVSSDRGDIPPKLQPDGWRCDYEDGFENEQRKRSKTNERNGKWLRHGPETYWHLIEGENRNIPLEQIGVTSGSFVMFESRCSHLDAGATVVWPTDRVIESSTFREFKLWQWLDVLNFKGKWCGAQIIKVFSSEGSRSQDMERISTADRGVSKAIDAAGDPRGEFHEVRVLIFLVVLHIDQALIVFSKYKNLKAIYYVCEGSFSPYVEQA